jgi:hypothetical protein
MRTRILLFLLGLILVPAVTYIVVLFAKGYRPNIQNGQITPTGLLAATSLPQGAEIIIDGQLRSATDTTINLPPGNYTVKIQKDGFSPWEKELTVQAEVVTRADATLFPTVPSLRALTATGASKPTFAPDGGRVVFIRTEGNLTNLYTLDLSESPLGSINRDVRLITSLPENEYELTWSPDGKQILATATPSAYLLNVADQQTTNLGIRTEAILAQWEILKDTINAPKIMTLPLPLREIMSSSAGELLWSPRENKILYTATASAVIPDNLIRPLPGSNTQPEQRQLEPGSTYVYDIEEDKNFLVSQKGGPALSWFPDSSRLVKVEANKVTIMEYDGSNPTVVYAGPMENGYAYPYPSGKQMLILTNLNPATSTVPNLYAVSLR